MKYEYKVIDSHKYVKDVRALEPQDSISDHIIIMEMINQNGSEGWRAVNPQDQIVYFERQT